MTRRKRRFVSIYFSDGLVQGRKKRDLTIAFDENDPLFKKCRQLKSSEVKEAIGVSSYKMLVKKANREARTPGNYIKCRLRRKLNPDH